MQRQSLPPYQVGKLPLHVKLLPGLFDDFYDDIFDGERIQIAAQAGGGLADHCQRHSNIQGFHYLANRWCPHNKARIETFRFAEVLHRTLQVYDQAR